MDRHDPHPALPDSGAMPEAGTAVTVAPGILWVRMPLPFALDHINIWLLEDDAGWTIVDTGIGSNRTRDYWERIFATALGGKPVNPGHRHPFPSGSCRTRYLAGRAVGRGILLKLG
jgi:hypothetical protein